MLCDQRLDDFDDLLLFSSGQTGNFFKGVTDASGWTAARSRGRLAEQFIDGNFQRIGQGGQLRRSQCGGPTFPVSNHLLVHVQKIGQVLLRQARFFAKRGDPRAERRTIMFGWAACLHAVIIRAPDKSY